MPDVMCETDPLDVGGHIDIEFYNVLREHREYLKKFFPFSRHLLSGSSRKITAARFNVINSSSAASQLIDSFRPQLPVNGTFITFTPIVPKILFIQHILTFLPSVLDQ